MVDEVQLAQALTQTLDGDRRIRKPAEKFLDEHKTDDGFATTLLKFVGSPEADDSLRLSAAIYLKNVCFRYWPHSQWSAATGDPEENKKYSISAADLENIRNNLLEAMLIVVHVAPLRKMLEQVVLTVAKRDFPAHWPVLPSVIESIKDRANPSRVLAGLFFLRHISKKYEFGMNFDEASELTTLVFPLLMDLAHTLSSTSEVGFFASEESSMMTKLICKVVWTSSHMSLAQIGHEDVSKWLEFMLAVIRAPVPNLPSSDDPDALNEMTSFKAKKWAMQYIQRFATRACSGNKNEAHVALKKAYLDVWAERLTGVCVDVVTGKVVASPRMANLGLLFLIEALKQAKTYRILKPYIEVLLFDVCLRITAYTEKDKESWELEPYDFGVADAFSVSNHRESAIDFMGTVARLRGSDFLVPMIQKAAEILLSSSDKYSDEQKHGALTMVAAIAKRLGHEDRVKDAKNLIESCVYPYVTHNNAFLRWKTCWVINELFRNHLYDVNTAFAGFKLCLAATHDPEFPVRAQAAAALGAFMLRVSHDFRELVSPMIPEALARIFAFLNEKKDNEMVITSLQCLITAYPEHIPPFAVEVLTYLAQALLSMPLDGEDPELASPSGISPQSAISTFSDSAVDVTFTFLSMLDAIKAAVSAVIETPAEKARAIFVEVAPVFGPLIEFLIHPERVDSIEDALYLLDALAQHTSSIREPLNLWPYFERCYRAVCGGSTAELSLGACENGFAADYLENMLPPFYNMIARDPTGFLGEAPGVTKPPAEMLLEMAKKSLTYDVCGSSTATESPGACSVCSRTGIAACALPFQAMLQIEGEKPAHMIQPSLEAMTIVFENLSRLEDPQKYALTQFFATLLLFNAHASLEALGSTLVVPLVMMLIDCDPQSPRDSRYVILALCKLAELSGVLPEILRNHLSQLPAKLMKLFSNLKRLEDEEDMDLSDDSSFDSEQDLDEEEDAVTASVVQKATEALEATNDADDGKGDLDFVATIRVPLETTWIDTMDICGTVKPVLQNVFGQSEVFNDLVHAIATYEAAARETTA